MWKTDDDPERRDSSTCEDKQEGIQSSSSIYPDNVPEILLPNEKMSASKEDLEDELSSSSGKIQVNEPNKFHGVKA